MYADDIVVLGRNHKEMQELLDILSAWCIKWGMRANIKNSQVVHACNRQHPRPTISFNLMGQQMEYVGEYKYLGCWTNEFGNNKKIIEALTADGK